MHLTLAGNYFFVKFVATKGKKLQEMLGFEIRPSDLQPNPMTIGWHLMFKFLQTKGKTLAAFNA